MYHLIKHVLKCQFNISYAFFYFSFDIASMTKGELSTVKVLNKKKNKESESASFLVTSKCNCDMTPASQSNLPWSPAVRKYF